MAEETGSIEQTCYWLASRKDYVPSAPLKGLQSCDVAVVGAGFTGLWSAFFLKKLDPDLDVAVIEQGVVGYGASGRNAGIVGNSVDFSDGLAISHFGFREA
ncbi:MAG: FAD-dependent oxidoreductase, partial [Cyanobacteria bacterium]|nr:FAD-dependent oxidoreductase [Cyanobacteriota bacterium]